MVAVDDGSKIKWTQKFGDDILDCRQGNKINKPLNGQADKQAIFLDSSFLGSWRWGRALAAFLAFKIWVL